MWGEQGDSGGDQSCATNPAIPGVRELGRGASGGSEGGRGQEGYAVKRGMGADLVFPLPPFNPCPISPLAPLPSASPSPLLATFAPYPPPPPPPCPAILPPPCRHSHPLPLPRAPLACLPFLSSLPIHLRTWCTPPAPPPFPGHLSSSPSPSPGPPPPGPLPLSTTLPPLLVPGRLPHQAASATTTTPPPQRPRSRVHSWGCRPTTPTAPTQARPRSLAAPLLKSSKATLCAWVGILMCMGGFSLNQGYVCNLSLT